MPPSEVCLVVLCRHGWDVTPGGCWIVRGAQNRDRGYVQIRIGGKLYVASRLAHVAWIGDIPEGFEVLHTCDNPPCINPAQLFTGTHAENMDDMINKDRRGRKLDVEMAKQIRAMRADGLSYSEIGLSGVGVSGSQAQRLMSGQIAKFRDGRR